MIESSDKLKDFNEVTALYRDELREHAYELCQTEDEADDIVQDAFVRAYKHWGALRKEGSRRYWLRAIVTNVAKNYLCKKNSKKQVVVKIPPEVMENIAEEIDGIKTEEIQDDNILRALDGLSEGMRVVVYLRCVCNFSHNQIIQATGIKPQALKRRLYRGKKKLREELNSYKSKYVKKLD